MQDLMARAREHLRYEPFQRRVRAQLADRPIVDSTRALLVWEPRRICPSFAVPVEDVLVAPEPGEAVDDQVEGVLHPGIPFGVHTAAGSPVSIAGGAGFVFDDDELAGYVALDFTAFDWHEEDERIFGHPRDPYHRVDVRASSRVVRIELAGEVVAETMRARLLCETNLPMRFYLPREDVRGELVPSTFRTHCPYKGDASYFSLGPAEDVLWCYERPLPELAAIAGLVAFWNERVDIFVDGERWTPPSGPIAKALADEFGV
jgi:uncharacterized protein (DUF427 family)